MNRMSPARRTSVGVTPTVPAASVSLWILTFDNATFWRLLWSARDLSSWRGTAAVVMLAGTLATLLIAVVRAMTWPLVGRPVAALLLLLSAVTAYFIEAYGVVVDRGMVRNVIQTDWREATDLLSLRSALGVGWRGVLPAVAIAVFARVNYSSGRSRQVSEVLLAISVAALTTGAALMLFFADYAATVRNHRELRYLLTPTNVFNGIWGVWRESRDVRGPLIQVGGDARQSAATLLPARPLLLVLVIGETARADNFSLGGYRRPTNGDLDRPDVIYFPNVSSCGTGCKGVCQRIPVWDLSKQASRWCGSGRCMDDVLITALRAATRSPASDMLVGLHMAGSHGPAYYERYPESARRFLPTCDTNHIQSCTRDALVNTYDNSIAFTSQVIAEAIDWLSDQSDRADAMLLYLSDHGESLGEGSFYLHGVPKGIAPHEQVHVPMLAWLSPGAARSLHIDPATVRSAASQPYSHDNLFHTLLGAFRISSTVYRPELDVMRPGLSPRLALPTPDR